MDTHLIVVGIIAFTLGVIVGWINRDWNAAKKYDPDLSKFFTEPEIQQAIDGTNQPKRGRGRPRKTLTAQKGNS